MVEINEIASSAQSKEEAQDVEKLWRTLIYGNPGTCKTHFSLTKPEPIMLIDTEGKSNEILDKFEKEVLYWHVDDYDEAREALMEALDALRAVRDGEVTGFEEGTIGTIVIDSMSELWEWAQQKHLQMAHPHKDPDDVKLQSALQGKGRDSDWQVIKEFHNDMFREEMIQSDFHLCWTAKSSEDYGAVLSGEADEPPMKPDGEKNNVYKCSELIHVFEGDGGIPMANLKKTSLTKLKFGRMEWPTFPKVRETINALHYAEMADEPTPVAELEAELGVDIFEGDPDIAYRERDGDE